MQYMTFDASPFLHPDFLALPLDSNGLEEMIFKFESEKLVEPGSGGATGTLFCSGYDSGDDDEGDDYADDDDCGCSGDDDDDDDGGDDDGGDDDGGGGGGGCGGCGGGGGDDDYGYE